MYDHFKRKLSWIVILILISSGSVIISQPRVNPFEIKQRTKLIGIDANVYDVDSLSNPILPSKDISNDTLLPQDTTSEHLSGIKLSNPFDVDHIPLRKSQFDDRKQKLTNSISSTKSSNGFLVWFLLLACGLLVIVINSQSKTLAFIPQTLINENMLKLIHREESGKFSSFFVLLYIIFVINFSITVYLIQAYYGGPKGINILLYVFASVVGIYLVRHVGLYLLGEIFGLEKSASLYSFTIMIFNSFVGLGLILLNFLLAYAPLTVQGPTVIITILFLVILLLLRYVRGLFIASEYIFSRLFQFIIYLCGFEIAPILICIKFLTKIV